MQLTSNEADKLIKRLKEEIQTIQNIESQSNTFVVATTENVESARPVYDFLETQKRIEKLQKEIRTVKHAMNMFNTTTILPEVGVTIDEALVLLPQLNEEARKLKSMGCMLPKHKIPTGSSSIIQYEYTNYDASEVGSKLIETENQIVKIQTTLDLINNSVRFEVDLNN